MAVPEIQVARGAPSLPRLVLLHGFLGRPAMWSGLLAVLEWPGDVLLVSLPGHGPAPWFPAEPSFEAVVHELAGVLPADAWLLGYSMGARVALALSLLPAMAVRGALLVGVHPGLEDPAEREARRLWDEQQAQMASVDLDAFLDAWESLPLLATQRQLPPATRDARRAHRRQHCASGVAWSLRVLGTGSMAPLGSRLAASSVPLWFVAGERDPRFAALSEALARRTPGGHAAIVPGVGHDVVLEAPAALADIVRRAAELSVR